MAWRRITDSLLHSTTLHSVASGCLRALVLGVLYYFIVYLLERASGGTTKQYRSRGFLQDVAYWLYYRSGLNQLLFMAAVLGFLSAKLSFIQLSFVSKLHPVARGTLWIVVADFFNYWIHRLQHRSRFMWAFHTMHHAQEQLNFDHSSLSSCGSFHFEYDTVRSHVDVWGIPEKLASRLFRYRPSNNNTA